MNKNTDISIMTISYALNAGFTEVNDDRIEKLQDKLAIANDFKPVRHKMEIYGLCRK